MNNTMKNLKDEIEGIVGDLLGLETQAFTIGAVTQQYVKWDDLFTQLFDTGKQVTSLIEQEKERAVREFREWWEKQPLGTSIHPNNVEQYLAERK